MQMNCVKKLCTLPLIIRSSQFNFTYTHFTIRLINELQSAHHFILSSHIVDDLLTFSFTLMSTKTAHQYNSKNDSQLHSYLANNIIIIYFSCRFQLFSRQCDHIITPFMDKRSKTCVPGILRDGGDTMRTASFIPALRRNSCPRARHLSKHTPEESNTLKVVFQSSHHTFT